VDAADAVFSGTVVRVDPPSTGPGELGPAYSFTVDVDEAVKGAPSASQVVRTAQHSAACGVDVRRGDRLLVFASTGQGIADPGPNGMQTTLCSGTRPLDGPVPDEVRAAARGEPIDCAAAIDATDRLPSGYRSIAGAVALPTDRTLGFDDSGTPPHFAKVGLAVRTGATARITVHQSRRTPVAMQWGGTPPRATLQVTECVAAGGARWVVFAGGLWVDRSVCARVEVVAERTGRVRIPIGRDCRPV
jgi:hypothetical protein